ncbi:MAG: hypothetical protein PWQ55_330 [Chloroflexota bacterium]|nr:hypothetical protein [Chloroflexota bacterium]
MTAVDTIMTHLPELMEPDAVNIVVEFTDLEAYDDVDYEKNLLELYREKYRNAQFDLVICLSDVTTKFISTYGETLFPNTPVVFVAEEHSVTNIPAYMTGIQGTVKIPETFSLALTLHPETRNVVLVSGSGDYDIFYEEMAREQIQDIQGNLTITYLSGLPLQELIASLQQMPANTIVLFLLMQEDENGTIYIPRSVVKEIAENVDLPIYGLWDTFLGHGIVGGYLSSAEITGQRIAQISQEVLQSGSVGSVPVEPGAYAYMFDWRELKKWDVSSQSLPEGSLVQFKEKTFWELYRWQVITYSTVFIAAVAAFILFKRRTYQKEKREREKSQRLLEQKVKERTAALNQANAKLERLSQIDGLTGLNNRRYFDERLKKEWQRHLRSGQHLSLIMCDIDYFKSYNDTYGHQAGDECLQQVSQTIQKMINRPFDVAARYGGEEFAIILPETCVDGALKVARAIQAAIAKQQIPHSCSPAKSIVSLSFGLACMLPQEGNGLECLIEKADQALYQSKHLGRDQIQVAE